MNYRQFGGSGWAVSEIGYGMWGMAGWSNSDDQQSLRSLQTAVDLGCNFFDTAYAYGEGKSEGFLGDIVRANKDKRLYSATKIPPKNLTAGAGGQPAGQQKSGAPAPAGQQPAPQGQPPAPTQSQPPAPAQTPANAPK